MQHNYYTILEVGREAGIEEIKRSYRTKAKRFHPDLNDSPKANQLFIILNLAYETLIDDRKRMIYNLKLDYAETTKFEENRKRKHNPKPNKNEQKASVNNSDKRFSKNKTATRATDKTSEDYYKKAPLLYNLFFICGMFSGFLILIVSIIGTIKNYWPSPFGLIAIPGIILIRDGWKGFMGESTLASIITKALNK